jgi:hypothetical protein
MIATINSREGSCSHLKMAKIIALLFAWSLFMISRDILLCTIISECLSSFIQISFRSFYCSWTRRVCLTMINQRTATTSKIPAGGRQLVCRLNKLISSLLISTTTIWWGINLFSSIIRNTCVSTVSCDRVPSCRWIRYLPEMCEWRSKIPLNRPWPSRVRFIPGANIRRRSSRYVECKSVRMISLLGDQRWTFGCCWCSAL